MLLASLPLTLFPRLRPAALILIGILIIMGNREIAHQIEQRFRILHASVPAEAAIPRAPCHD